MRKQAENVGTKIDYDTILEADLSKRPFELKGDSGTIYTADALVVATGAQAKWLGLPSEEKYQAGGVSACATCDGFFYRGKEVVVVGGGNTAVEEALYLANLASKVTLVHRRDALRSEKILQDRLFKNEKIEVVWDTQVEEILGTESPAVVTGVRLKNRKTGETTEMSTDGVFIAIGHAPAVDLVKDQVKMKESGYIWTEADSTQTSIPGVYAAGDVTDEHYRQAVTAAGMGCMAALEAERYLAALEAKTEAAE